MLHKIQDVFAKFRWSMIQALAPRRTVYSRGLKFTLPCDNWITHYRWKSFNEKEPMTLDWIDRIVKDGSVFFDVGANIGVYSLYSALRHPKLKIFSFEPEYSNLHLLRDNLVINGLERRVLPFSIGLDKQRSLSHLHIQDLTPGAALHTVTKENLTATREGKKVVLKEGIAVWALDEFCKEIGSAPNFMKIDVDGTEAEVLEGGFKTLSSPSFYSLMIEFPSDESARHVCESLLKRTGLKKVSETKDHYQVWVRNNE